MNSRGLRRFERFKAEAMQGLYEGKSLSPNDGVLAPLMKHLLESMMDGELENHLNEEKGSGNSNRRNGRTKKRDCPTKCVNKNTEFSYV
ncbi:hypothetical protein ABTW24_14320 [Sphingobacterium thalpophilum]|uniref:Transposase, Mutator family n=1 Tax=Sphingobacterium thalpophilum TaxID=259 RepID=A0ABV4HE73_9SPHI|nr:hypothetical protein [Sphingobacterium thalpophilum]